jgi:hypothetical protein
LLKQFNTKNNNKVVVLVGLSNIRKEETKKLTFFQENKHNFDKLDLDSYLDLGTPYDYSSIMHYSSTAFRKMPGQITLRAKKGRIPGRREVLTKIDVEEIRKLYRCNSRGILALLLF